MEGNHIPTNIFIFLGSIGLCSTGQILEGGHWLSVNNSSHFSYSFGDSVGVLVYIDDRSERETWEGKVVNVRAGERAKQASFVSFLEISRWRAHDP